MLIQKTPYQTSYKPAVGIPSDTVDFTAAYRQFDWLDISQSEQ